MRRKRLTLKESDALRALKEYADHGQAGINPSRGAHPNGVNPFARWSISPMPHETVAAILAREEEQL
jgi:hypothetical protein